MKIQPFEEYTQKYEKWFDTNRFAYESELEAVRIMLPKQGKGVEIGVGSGKFAVPLEVKFGLDPSPKMRALAEKRGIEVKEGIAEKLPYKTEMFDYALMVTTLCFLDDIHIAFKEIHRILNSGGFFINGFIDKESELGKFYQKHKQESDFYKVAKFYSVDEVVGVLKKENFENFEFVQTIFQDLSDVSTTEPIESGHGRGSFVVIKAKKSGEKK